jgi:hypothetical protein
LLFPQTDAEYIHFEDARDHPFDRAAQGFSRVNAWWLADAALLSYWDEGAARPIWNRAGLDFEFLDDEGVQCHIGYADGIVVVAFRGTQPNDWHDLLNIARIKHGAWDLGGAVHEGFRDAHRRFWPLLEARLKRLDPTGGATWFTGHSLGAALATLSMDRWRARGLYTIGSPPVGNRRFARGFDTRHAGRCFRYVNHRDIVVHVARRLSFLIGDYTHVRERRYIDAQGVVSGRSPSLADWLVLLSARRKVPRATGGSEALPLVHWPGFLIDHTPRRYAVRIWNDYAAG